MSEIETIKLNSWKEFRETISTLDAEREARRSQRELYVNEAIASRKSTGCTDHVLVEKIHKCHPGAAFLYRGHGCSSWKLQTTLERAYPDRKFSLRNVFHHLSLVYGQLPGGEQLEFSQGDFCTDAADLSPALSHLWTRHFLDGLKRLRHMGVPSPLLDWTSSPFVAAYFAFADVDPKQTEDVAVCQFQEYTGPISRSCCNGIALEVLGPFGRTHERQTRQQGEYTLCVTDSDRTGQSVIVCDPELYFQNARSASMQYERLRKYTIPCSERRVAMRDLAQMNITEASLFDGEDAMARTLFRRTIDWLDNQ